MNLQESIEKERKRQEYNNEPVFYCTRCLSLRIMSVPKSEDCFCDKCNSNQIGQTSIEHWGELYKERNHHSFLEEY